MTTEEILKLDTANMSEEAARAYGIDLLENNLAPNKELIKRRGSFALLFSSTYVVLAITESPKLLNAIVLFLAAVCVFMFMNVFTTKFRHNKMLKQFKDGTFNGGYVKFLKEYQDYLIRDQAKQEQRNELEAKKNANKKPSRFRKEKPGQRSKQSISDIANQRAKNK